MSKPSSDGYVTTRELASELRSMRWEFRFLIATAALANAVLLKGAVTVPGIQQALSLLPLI